MWAKSGAKSSVVPKLAFLCRPATETHEIAERKQKELERLREAWGIQEGTVEGAAFDRDLQVPAQLIGLRLAMMTALQRPADWHRAGGLEGQQMGVLR